MRTTANGSETSSRNGAINGQASWPAQLFLFARNFVKHPTMIGWMFPSSQFVVEEVLKQIDWANTRTIVEYGPGLGTFTRPILERMRPDATLVAFETNDEFYGYLTRSLNDPRLRLLHGSATGINAVLQDLRLPPADCVISGIPFKTLREELRREVVRETYSALRPQGQFLVYQLSGAVRPYLERVFGRVERDFELLNILPARLYYCAR